VQTPTLAIDFDAIRAAIITATERGCSLPQGHVVVAEPEVEGQPRPRHPYVTIKITTPAARYGSDSIEMQPDGTAAVAGPRAMTVSFNCYGHSHEQAYGYLAMLQARLDADPLVLAPLAAAGVAVWKPGAIADLSQLVQTAYEGRAQMDVMFGITSNLTMDLGIIETAGVQGTVAGNPAVSI